jgi:hypothetical protein
MKHVDREYTVLLTVTRIFRVTVKAKRADVAKERAREKMTNPGMFWVMDTNEDAEIERVSPLKK